MFISVKLGDASSMMINLDAVATVKWGNPTIVSLVLGQQILLSDVDDNHQLFRGISSDWEYRDLNIKT